MPEYKKYGAFKAKSRVISGMSTASKLFLKTTF